MPDILDNLTSGGRVVPALNATSDMPVLDISNPPPSPATPEPEQARDAPAAPAPEPQVSKGDGGEEQPDPNPDARTRREQRFADLTRQRDEERARAARAVDAAAALTEQTRALMAKLEQLTAPPPAETPAQELRPLRSQYEQPEDYDAALVEWSSRRAVQQATEEWEKKQKAAAEAEEKRRNEAAYTEEQRQQMESWGARRSAAVEKYPDFAEIAESDGVQITMPMRDAIVALDEGAEVAYHLGKNPAEATAIAKLAPVQQIAAIGRLAAKISSPPPPVTPPSTPPPINPLRTGSAPEVSPDEDPNYMEKRLQQLRSQRIPGNIGMARN